MYSAPPALTTSSIISSTFSRVSTDIAIITSLVVLASQICLLVNCGLNEKPSFAKNSMERLSLLQEDSEKF